MKTTNFSNVGDLRRFFDDIDDENPVLCQVIDKHAKAWNLWGKLSTSEDGKKVFLQLEHDELEHLPDIDNNEFNSDIMKDTLNIESERKKLAEKFLSSILAAGRINNSDAIKEAFQIADDFMSHK